MQSAIRLFSSLILCGTLASCQLAENPSPPEITTATPQPERSSEPVESTQAKTTRSAVQVPAIETEMEPVTTVWQRLQLGFQLQEHYQHPSVQAQLNIYRGDQRYFDLIAARARPFLFFIADEIEKRELPMELALVPVVESTFNPSAYSRENAVGLWQFLAGTGREFGLQQDWWYDGRRDPQASTLAALDYLQALHQQFDGDWLLALAAYNTGGANLSRALRRVEPDQRQFWNLPLALETRSHVPKVLALSRLIQNPHEYGIQLEDIPNEDPLIKIDVGSQIDLARVAEIIELETEVLRTLNPGYLQWATHPEAPQSVAVPASKAQMLRDGLANLDRSEFVTWEHYRIRSGDTLGGIARRLNTTVDVLQVVNNLSGTQIIAGRSLLIPRGLAAVNYADLTPPPIPDSVAPTAVPQSYTVRRGDNLWTIARRFDLRSQAIADHNGLQLDALMQPGQILDLSFAQAANIASAGRGQSSSTNKIYRVRRGDSMASIARSFSTELTDLLRWNGLSRNDLIFPGQQIYISAP